MTLSVTFWCWSGFFDGYNICVLYVVRTIPLHSLHSIFLCTYIYIYVCCCWFPLIPASTGQRDGLERLWSTLYVVRRSIGATDRGPIPVRMALDFLRDGLRVWEDDLVRFVSSRYVLIKPLKVEKTLWEKGRKSNDSRFHIGACDCDQEYIGHWYLDAVIDWQNSIQ
jgi:hypothetical protein